MTNLSSQLYLSQAEAPTEGAKADEAAANTNYGHIAPGQCPDHC